MSVNNALNGLHPLAYMGVNSPNPAAQIFSSDSDPTPNDSLNVTIGDIWINLNTQPPGQPAVPQNIWMLTALNGGNATWTEIGQTGNVLNVVGGTNITVNTVAGTATVNLNPSVTLAGTLTVNGADVSINSTAGNTANVALTNNQVSPISSTIFFQKTRNEGIIQSGDSLGIITFNGFDGLLFQSSASIVATSIGTIGAGRVPSTLAFFTTPDAISNDVERVLIDQNGAVTINAPSAGNICFVATGNMASAGDNGAGTVGQTSITNATVANAAGGGKLTIDSQSANPGTQTGFIKVYIGTTVAYIPYFTNIAP